MEHEDTEMIKRIQSDYLEPDKLTCHLGWYRRQQQSKIIEQRDELLEALKESRRRLVFLHQAIMGETKPIFDDIEIRKTGSCIIFIDEAIANATEDKIIDDADLCNRLAKGDPPEV